MIQTAAPSTKPSITSSFNSASAARTSTATPATATTPASTDTLAERIRRRAYEIFQARKGGPGNAHTDWIQAEREIGLGSGSASVSKSPSFPTR